MIGVWAVALLASSPVVRATRGQVLLGERSVAAGAVVDSGKVLEVGPNGFGEVHLPRLARIRMFSSTRVAFDTEDDGRLLLRSGRIWIQVGTRAVVVESLRQEITIAPRSSVLVERTRISGTLVAVRRGSVRFEQEENNRRVVAGQLLRITPGEPKVPEAQPGGGGLFSLVTGISRRALMDPLGVESFLLRRAVAVTPRSRTARTVQQVVRGQAELLGSETGPAGSLVEEGLRPPPFFEDEVPPKGPNVRVEVEFAED